MSEEKKVKEAVAYLSATNEILMELETEDGRKYKFRLEAHLADRLAFDLQDAVDEYHERIEEPELIDEDEEEDFM
ncbi:MAG: hypothetical protein DRO39_07820 [Thermoprotei archaeon]|nr:MAG: hypothetical protein DRO39_07820 [Thermoprotei archaeon]